MKNNLQKGYAILTTVVVVSILMLIAIGLSRSTYKQLIISSGAKDSQTAFYWADTASECALYADYAGKIFKTETVDGVVTQTTDLIESFNCGGQDDMLVKTISNSSGSYTIEPNISSDFNAPCFRIEVEKEITAMEGVPVTKTTIKASGYNICNKNNIRTVERTIEIIY